MAAASTWATYLTRIIPAWSVCGIATLLVFSFLIEPYGRGEPGRRHGAATVWQLVLGFYTVALHILSILFPARVCFALGDVIKHMKASAAAANDDRRGVKTQTVETEKGSTAMPAPLFVIMLPAYKEDMGTLEETLRVLASHAQARHCYHVYLAMEEKEEKAEVKAQTLINTFRRSFYRMSFTLHPQGIPGEAQGKSSNESWAARQACRDYPEEVEKQNVIITTMDADTHLSQRYFQQVARMHFDFPETRDTTMYVPPLVFDRNLHHVPLPVRTADLMWAGAGISSLYTGSLVCIPTSVYSLPMILVEHVGGWDTGPGAIGEDMHMYIKCFFALSGNLDVKVIYAAASQCNVSSDMRGLAGYIDGIGARYRQALRHMWGTLDTGFAIRECVKMVYRHRRATHTPSDLPLSAPKYVCDTLKVLRQQLLIPPRSANWTAFYTSTGLHRSLVAQKRALADPDDPTNTTTPPPKPIHVWNLLTLFLRLFEAHFLPIHLSVILTTSSIFMLFTPTFLVPDTLRAALDFAGWCRLGGWLLMLAYFWRYEQYHRLCVGLRQEEMRKAGLLEDMLANDGFSFTTFLHRAGALEPALFPLGGFIFGAIPALQAVLSHIFTERLTYVVSLKPQQLALRSWGGGRGSGGGREHDTIRFLVIIAAIVLVLVLAALTFVGVLIVFVSIGVLVVFLSLAYPPRSITTEEEAAGACAGPE
ncbi:hypothetical protein B0A55_04337 [Friedmanniomyces simplex]|uniref:Glycosyltransferase 2-like domain-containing protein n=1 Tax=Friedmanniomyces simplex TaxID=329884 RepID=A0A4U0XQT2_9PEZI|nr:hypothetical protein B0A55_04337 [Friedmanniomyces simplex]